MDDVSIEYLNFFSKIKAASNLQYVDFMLRHGIKNLCLSNNYFEKYASLIKETGTYYEMSSLADLYESILLEWPNILTLIKLNEDCLNFEPGNNVDEIFEQNSLLQRDYYLNIIGLNKAGNGVKYYSYYDSMPIYGEILQIIKLGGTELIPIYKDIIENNLYDPNKRGIGNSNEVFWYMLPNPFTSDILKSSPLKEKIIELNKKVLFDNRIDYHMLNNGGDLVNYYLQALDKSYNSCSPEELTYRLGIIKYILKNNCSILDGIRYDGDGELHDWKPYIFTLFEQEYCQEIEQLKKDILDIPVIEKQISISKYPSPKRDKAIDFYLDLLKNNTNIDDSIKQKILCLKS